MAFSVTLLGGESTGKTSLALQLQQTLLARGIRTLLVPEYLRQWCEVRGRAPRAEEQRAVALEQIRIEREALGKLDVQVVISDTSSLVIAAYSELYFNDRSLFPLARHHQEQANLTLLMGLDLPWVADGLFRDSPAVRDATDAVLRRELQAAGLPFQTIYGHGASRLQQALRAVGSALGQPLVEADPDWGGGRVAWDCDRCSDPGCEHRLFTHLLSLAPP